MSVGLGAGAVAETRLLAGAAEEGHQEPFRRLDLIGLHLPGG